MSELSKQALKVDNNQSFPNNNGGLITPAVLRAFNVNMIDSMVDEIGYNLDSASWNQQIDALEQFTASVSNLSTGSLLVTASFDNGTRNLTFTKGNNTQFAVNIPDASGSAGNFVTTSSFNQYTASTDSSISQLNASSASQQISINNLNTTTASLLVETQNLELFSASALTSLSNLNTATSSLFTSASLALTTASVSGQTMTFRKGDGTTFNVTLPAGGSGSVVDTGSLVTTASFNAYTSSNDQKVNSLISATGSYATTGSNTFTGDQTLIDNAGNLFTITDTSGSMMLVAKSFTSASAHLSSSILSPSGSQLNLIFKTNNNTADTIISGSNNIFVNPAAPTAGFKRYLSSNNIALSGGFPQISGSMQYSPAIINNYFGAAQVITMRGPVSASAQTISGNNILGAVNIGISPTLHAERLTGVLSITSNYINGNLNVIASQSEIRNATTITSNNLNGTAFLNLYSSSVTFNNNTINDTGFTFQNLYFSASAGLGQAAIQRNTITGQNNQIIISGSLAAGTTTQPQFNDNLIGGFSNIIYSETTNARISGLGSAMSHYKSIIYGNSLIVTASMAAGEVGSHGSAFFGRYNASDGVRDKSSDIVFAVGTGTSTTRKTGFLIDSGSNSFFEGTVNISGSLLVNGIAPAAINTSSFATTGSNAFNGNQTISGSVSIRGNTTFTSFAGDQSSVILGNNALGASSGGSINVAIGNNAMRFASGSSQNVAIGADALSITTGSNNVAIGSYAMSNNLTGNQNLAIGVGALNNNTVGSTNVAIGNDSMIFASGSNMNFNIAVGASSLTRNQTDSQIAIGANALQYVTTGNANTAIGRLALQNTTTGFDNIAIGTNALLSNITGNRNTAIGKDALRNAAVNANLNTAIGFSALYDVESPENTAVGSNAFRQLISGSDNLGLGYLTGYDVLNGNNNTLIGSNLRGQSAWDTVLAISNGLGDTGIKFFNSGSQTTLTNNTLISGSLTTTGSLTIQSGSSFFANGNKQFNYGAFQDNTTQSGSANVSASFQFNTTDEANGVSVVNDAASRPTRLTVANGGVYNIQFSTQISQGSGAADIAIWLKKNGTNVPASAGVVTLPSNNKTITSWNYVLTLAANDYVEITYQSNDSGTTYPFIAASGNIPAAASIIASVTQVR